MFDFVCIQILVATCGFILAANAAIAQTSGRSSEAGAYGITQAEKDAYGDDASRLCSSAYPDAEKLLACMKANKNFLSPACSATFAAGLNRRGV